MLARICSLALLLVVLAATPPAFAAARYVALGDSYSSGTGTREYRLGKRCERSHHGYPTLVTARRPGLDLVLAACGGATTSDVRDDQVRRLDAGTRWVTITIGGNDIGFSAVVRKCAEPRSSRACRTRIRRAQDRINDPRDLPSALDAAYRAIRTSAPAATVIVLGYPRLFTREDCNAATFFSRGELDRLNQTADVLRDKIRERVAAAGRGFVFRDAIPAFDGHAVCSRNAWLNGLSNPKGESYHPNRAGHLHGYAPLVLDAMAQPLLPPPPPPVSDRISNDGRLHAASDQFLRSADGRYRLVMQKDGNLVLYGPSGRALWASNTRGRGSHHVRMQADGNLV
ncbi:MAG TPA: GDSL-type esterase/lipase family protein, partial [Solirubrobacteraceae bacterium]|nr:GDSL-type esterase/lipase family protein [Solirubrobacteraceae bacterium]